MKLELLQNNIAALVKSRELKSTDDYIRKIQSSENLLLIKKIGHWWRKIQLEQFCVLTTTLLKTLGQLDTQLANFISETNFSSFREEIGNQFLAYIIATDENSLTQTVASFEFAIIQKRLGYEIDSTTSWKNEPFTVISGLLNNSLNLEQVEKGEYEVVVSSGNKEELFQVKKTA